MHFTVARLLDMFLRSKFKPTLCFRSVMHREPKICCKTSAACFSLKKSVVTSPSCWRLKLPKRGKSEECSRFNAGHAASVLLLMNSQDKCYLFISDKRSFASWQKAVEPRDVANGTRVQTCRAADLCISDYFFRLLVGIPFHRWNLSHDRLSRSISATDRSSDCARFNIADLASIYLQLHRASQLLTPVHNATPDSPNGFPW